MIETDQKTCGYPDESSEIPENHFFFSRSDKKCSPSELSSMALEIEVFLAKKTTKPANNPNTFGTMNHSLVQVTL